MNREYAKEIFTHYFKIVYDKVGLCWDEENDKEVEDAIDAMLEEEWKDGD